MIILKLHDVFNPEQLVVVVTQGELMAYPSRGAAGNTSVQTEVGIIGVRETTAEIAAQIEAQQTKP